MEDSELIETIQDTSLCTRERGDALENYVVDQITEMEHSVNKTKGSGSLHGDGDIFVNNNICLDGKVHGQCLNVNIKRTELEKIRQQAAKNGRIGAIVTPVLHEEKVNVYITLTLEDFMENIYPVLDINNSIMV